MISSGCKNPQYAQGLVLKPVGGITAGAKNGIRYLEYVWSEGFLDDIPNTQETLGRSFIL